MKYFLAAAVLPTLFSVSAHATLDLRHTPGRQTITQNSGNRSDFCFLPKALPGYTPRAKLLEKDQATEADLCAINLYDASSDAAACPKLNSTNPGIRIFKVKPAAGGRAKWEAAECGKVDPKGEAKQVAKFKQSMTCSYAPSPLAYYHVSRVLDAQPIVPVGVIRTMDARTHMEYVKKGAEAATKIYGEREPNAPILRAWTKLWPNAHEQKPAILFDASGTQVWGGLLDSPNGKELYSEVFKKPGEKFHYDTRYQDFKSTTPYIALKNPAPVAKLGTDLAKVAQTMVQMKDVSDMILLDYLLNQQDRMGNIHYISYYLYMDNGELKYKKKKKEGEHGEEMDEDMMKAKGAVIVKRMLMADNDCGVTKDNLMKANQILEGVSHMGLDTYRRLLWLATKLQTAEWKAFFKDEVQFTTADLEGTSSNRPGLAVNAANAARMLQEKCRKGNLNLDLNILLQIQGKNITDSKPFCDLHAGYEPGV